MMIKGAEEFIEQLASLGYYTITCTDGKITNSKFNIGIKS
jgi:hypothetical protein